MQIPLAFYVFTIYVQIAFWVSDSLDFTGYSPPLTTPGKINFALRCNVSTATHSTLLSYLNLH